MKLTEQMRSMIKRQPVVFCATADCQGLPNVSPRCVLRILDDDKLVFADLFSGRTRANLEANPRMVMAAVDLRTYEGYQFHGTTRFLDSGLLWEEISQLMDQAPSQPPPMELWFERAARNLMSSLAHSDWGSIRPQVHVLHIDEIWNLAPGASCAHCSPYTLV